MAIIKQPAVFADLRLFNLRRDKQYDKKISEFMQPFKNREYYTQEQNGFSAHGLSRHYCRGPCDKGGCGLL